MLKSVPVDATLTPAACSEERARLGRPQLSGRLYVLDRGYADYELFARIVGAGSVLVARVKDNAFVVQEERPSPTPRPPGSSATS